MFSQIQQEKGNQSSELSGFYVSVWRERVTLLFPLPRLWQQGSKRNWLLDCFSLIGLSKRVKCSLFFKQGGSLSRGEVCAYRLNRFGSLKWHPETGHICPEHWATHPLLRGGRWHIRNAKTPPNTPSPPCTACVCTIFPLTGKKLLKLKKMCFSHHYIAEDALKATDLGFIHS